MDAKRLLELVHQAEKLKNVTRHSDTSQGRRESVAEHTWRCMLMCWFLRDELVHVDMDKVLHMLLIHDLGEMFTGDIPAFDKTKADEAREEQLLAEWTASLPAPYAEEMAALYAEMDARETMESRVYKAIDQVEAVIQHNEASLDTWLDVEYEMNRHYGTETCACAPALTELRALVREETLRKIDGQA